MFSAGSFGASQDATIPMGGMAMDTQPSTQAAKPAKKEDRVSVLPATVRVLEDAASKAKVSGGEVLIHGSEPGMVLIVGCVESVTKQASSAEFVVNDATGRIRVKYFSNEADASLAAVEAGKYITVAGSLRTTPAVHVSANSLRAVRSADEISYHMIEVAHAMLKLTRPQPAMMAKDVQMTQAFTSTPPPAVPQQTADVPMTPAKEVAPAAPVAATPAPAALGKALDETALKAEVLKVVSLLHSENPSEEGIHKDKIFAKLPSTPQADVWAMIRKLDEEGEIFSTINEDFYAPM